LSKANYLKRWIFYLNLPLTGAGFVMITLFLKLNFLVGSFGEKLRRFDWIGGILFVASTTSIMIPVTWGGVSYPWDSWHTLVPLILGIAGIVCFGFYERYFAIEPMMPPTIFANWSLRITYFTTVIHGMILWSLLYYIPLYYEAVKGYSPIITGTCL
jgi:Fungal trichothecene efflux pump (TRI12)